MRTITLLKGTKSLIMITTRLGVINIRDLNRIDGQK
jgi:hypothetical protein